jgi:hypothetical protein
MNLIDNDVTRYATIAVVVLLMLTMSAILLRWARRQGWW